MNILEGKTQKLRGVLKQPVEYVWPIGEAEWHINADLGKKVTLQFLNRIECLHCHRNIKKTFNQGYCYPCFMKLARCDFCILKPELCHYHLGTCREPEWGLANCTIPHTVYLANTSGLKVGITRNAHIPSRWIDQGAVQAIPLFSVGTRRDSGLIESRMREWVGDKTHWKKMLSPSIPLLNMAEEREKLHSKASAMLQSLGVIYQYAETEQTVLLEYPVLEFPKKIVTLKIEETKPIEGTLLGVKGQYLLLDTGVINLRALGGYYFSISIDTFCSNENFVYNRYQEDMLLAGNIN